MRILKTAILAAAVMASGAAPAAAQDYYAGGQFGISSGGGILSFFGLDLVLDQGVVASGVFGKDSGKTRIEGEIAIRRNDIDKFFLIPADGDMSSQALMGNFYYEFGDGAGVSPYVGAGLGIANVTMDSVFLDVSDSAAGLATQFMLGMIIPLSDTMSLNLDFRTFWASPEFATGGGGTFDQPYKINSMAVGLQASF